MEEILSKSTNGLRKVGLASLAVTLTLGAGVFTAGSAAAVEGFDLGRIKGEDRYDTSTAIADEFNATNEHVILSNGQPGSYADALSANFLAGAWDVPLLLTMEDKTPESVLDQLEQQETKKITVVGGNGTVSEEQVEDLRDAGYEVERIAGEDRFDTNADVIGKGGDAVNGVGIVATGFNFPDALAAGPISYQGHPLALSSSDDLTEDVVKALKDAGVTKVLIMGGTNAVGPEVEQELKDNDIEVLERFSGKGRDETSAEAADWAVENLGFSKEALNVASGYTKGYGADALAGGPLTGMQVRPLLITESSTEPGAVNAFIE
jgi:N-acetylmuramoyl-L-alanine amidase